MAAVPRYRACWPMGHGYSARDWSPDACPRPPRWSPESGCLSVLRSVADAPGGSRCCRGPAWTNATRGTLTGAMVPPSRSVTGDGRAHGRTTAGPAYQVLRCTGRAAGSTGGGDFERAIPPASEEGPSVAGARLPWVSVTLSLVSRLGS